MNYTDPQHHQLPKTNWQRVGQLKLQAGSNPDGTIKAWLMNVLGNFVLPDDLISRLLASIEEATARVLSPTDPEAEYLEIIVLAPTGQGLKGHTWGFFRVERTSVDSKIGSAKELCVEYYLYLDSKTENRR